MANLVANSSGDAAGNYYTGAASDLTSVPVSSAVNPAPYACPGTATPPNNGPFTGACYGAATFGPVGTHKVWTPFAAWNGQQTVLPLPHTIEATANGFLFSQPPVFNYGNDYTAQLPNDDTQPPAQYYGNNQSDFYAAPTSTLTQPVASFTLPESGSDTPFTQLEGFSDWAATVSLSNASESTEVTFASGSPLAFLTFNTEYAWFQPTGSVMAFWYPENYTPAGVAVGLGGAGAPGVELSVTYDGATASYTTAPGDTEQTIMGSLQQACQQQFTTLNASAVQSGSNGYYFVLSAQAGAPGLPPQSDAGLTTSEVSVSPTGGEAYVLTEGSSSASPTGELVGFTIVNQAATASGNFSYTSSYMLIAPSGSQWTVQDNAAAIACQFPGSGGGTIIVVAMPAVSAEAYANYYTPATGAAAILQSYWAVMSPYAYGCPRHLDGGGNDDGTGTQLGPNAGNQFTPRVTLAGGMTTVTTEFYYNLSYPLGQPAGAYNGTLFGLFPHQWRAYANNTSTPLQTADGAELTYQTVMGTLKLCGGDGFSTNYTFPGVLPALPNAAQLTGNEVFNVYDYPAGSGVNPMSLTGQTLQDASTPVWSANNFGASSPGVGGTSPAQNGFIPIPPAHQQNWGIDSYDWGKYVAGVADLIQPAFLLGATAAGQDAISQLNAQLGQWLSGALLYADDTTRWPPGVEPWQKQQGNTTFAGAAGLNSNQQFLYYDQQWLTFIPYPTAYYADTLLNDHHFHYGYWLRAASQLALAQASGLDPNNAAGTFINNYGATINLLVKDIANPLRADQGAVGDSAAAFPDGPATPFLRHFDGYFGHSWASGLPHNILNQESLSEAMSAWTGVIMWGELTDNTGMRDLGVWMYTHEMFSFYEYWLDCAQNASGDSTLFPAGSPANIVGDEYAESIGGGDSASGVGFCTQVYNSYLELTSDFGMDPLYLTGIEWLPFHGGSLYLSSTDTAVSTTLQAVYQWMQANSQYQWNQWQQSTSPATLSAYQPTYLAASWEPVAWNHAATLGADTAVNLWAELEQAVGSDGASLSNQPPGGWKPLGGESVSYSYYWINNVSALGARDATVSADYPFAVKFLNGTTATYVVWNLTGSSLDVNFSDGQAVSGVAPYSLQVSPAAG